MSTLALAPETDPDRPAAPPAPTALRPARSPAERLRDPLAFPGIADQDHDENDADVAWPRLVWPRRDSVSLPDPTLWCGTLVRACAETLLGARPVAQLTRWLTPRLHAALAHRAPGQLVPTAPSGGPHPDTPRRVRVLRVHLQAVDEQHHEAAVVIDDGRRVRAAAVRIELYRGRWRATALQIA